MGGLSVLHIIAGKDDEIFAREFENLGVSPDKLPGFDTVLSAMATGIAEVQPKQNGLVLLPALIHRVKGRRLPI